MSEFGVVWDKLLIEVGKAKEGAYVLHFCWYGPFFDAFDLDWVHCNGVLPNDHPQVLYFRKIEVTFLQFEGEEKFLHALENLEGAKSMYFRVVREDEEIIHVDNEPSFGNHISEGVIHKPLEGGWGVAQSKEHDSWLEEPFMSNEDRLPLVAFFDANIVVPRSC